MFEQRAIQNQTNDHIVDLVSTALRQEKRSGLSEMLKSIANAMNADGCLIWEVAPNSNLNIRPPSGHLFVLDQWTADNHVYAFYDLPFKSGAGWVVLNEKPLNISDSEKDERISKSHAKQLGAKSALVVPIFFSDSSRRAALILYRRNYFPFTEDEEVQARQLALLLPALYQTIRAKIIFNLTKGINDRLQKAKPRLSQFGSLVEGMKNVIKSVCNLVRDTFDCVESSIFLEDPRSSPRAYRVVATTWQGDFRKKAYHKKEQDKCLTAWVVAHHRSVKIFDLNNFERDKNSIQRDYHGINWSDSLNFQSTIREVLKLEGNDVFPPLSFMASPIMVDDKVLGVIRCCTAQSGPRYFVDRDLELLELVATQIGQYWSKWLSEIEIQKENKSWQELVKSIGRLNKFAFNELIKDIPDERTIFTEALRVTESVVKGSDILDVRILNDKTRELYFAQTYGAAWQKGSVDTVQSRQQITYPVDSTPPKSIGEYVFQTAEVQSFTNPPKSPYYAGKVNFPRVKSMIVAPIKVANETIGVLDILSIKSGGFPGNAERIAELLGQQIGLYQYLATAIKRLRKAESDLKNEIKERNQMLEDLSHQVKTPINQAFRRTRRLLEGEHDDRKIPKLQAIRGLCGKAKRVSMSMKLLATLARGEQIELKLESLYFDYLIRTLIEAASDSRLMIEPSSGIRTEVKRETFYLQKLDQVKVDFDLLEQAVGNILDNACKYSYENKVVQIYGGLTQNGRFHISVVNEGFPINSKDVSRCIERGWRSDKAKWVTGEGSGIGLWIVKGIMDAHGGELLILPTSPQNKTEVKLIFPL